MTEPDTQSLHPAPPQHGQPGRQGGERALPRQRSADRNAHRSPALTAAEAGGEAVWGEHRQTQLPAVPFLTRSPSISNHWIRAVHAHSLPLLSVLGYLSGEFSNSFVNQLKLSASKTFYANRFPKFSV